MSETIKEMADVILRLESRNAKLERIMQLVKLGYSKEDGRMDHALAALSEAVPVRDDDKGKE